MPELPEVEVTRRGLVPAVLHHEVAGAAVRCPMLRAPVPDLARLLTGRTLASLERRAKYLVWRFEKPGLPPGWLVTHMGMSGSWRIWPANGPIPAPGRHDHIDIDFGDVVLRYTDPRRFGAVLWFDVDPYGLPPLAKLGFEPWDARLTPEVFEERLRRTHRSIKETLLSGDVVVGCGNIYCSEALWDARIRPTRPADGLSLAAAGRLLGAVRSVLERAVAAGGSTLHDFHGPEGETGWFPLSSAVYGREGEPCPSCGRPVKRIEQGGRSTFWCPHCQH